MVVRPPLLVVPIVICLSLSACGKTNNPGAPPPTAVGVVTLAASAVTTSTELTGRTTATLASDVRPQVEGIIQARLFTEGSIVRQGQPLYRIDRRPYQATFDQAKASLENAHASYLAAKAQADRYSTLSDVEAVSKQQIDNAVAAARQGLATVHQAEATLEAARINLNYTIVRAPISGRIGRSAVTPGALVTTSQTTALATIQRLNPIYVDLTQSSDDLLALRRSLAKRAILPARTTARLKLQDGSDYPQAGTLEFAEVTVNPDSGTVALRAQFPNPQAMLLPGMFVRVSTPQGIVPNGILAPQQGIARDPKGNATALVVGSGNKIDQRNVVIAQSIGNAWLVTRGLKSGDRLVVQGNDKVQPGTTVNPVAVNIGKIG